MKNLVLFDDNLRENLLPLSYTRPCSELRIGILTITEKWEKRLGLTASFKTVPYLSAKYPTQNATENIFINSRLLPNAEITEEITSLENGTALVKDEIILAVSGSGLEGNIPVSCNSEVQLISRPHDIFSLNGKEIEKDFALITKGRNSQQANNTNTLLHPENIFIEEGAKINCAILNAENGPIYIGKNVEIMEGSIVRGPLAMCANSVLKLGTKIYGATTLGPHCKVGGEINNSVLTGYSSKAHDGFLGNSVLGEWCNLGADTNNSNLKNNYAEVKLWNYKEERFTPTSLQFCGLIMGDHSKCGINTMFNTGTVVGVSANIFGSGFPRNFVPSFSWGGSSGFTTYQFRKVKEVAEKVMARRKKTFDDKEEAILLDIFQQSAKFRSWESQV